MQLNVRQSWDQIMLGEYLRYRSIIHDEGKSEFQRKLESVALLANVDVKWLQRVPASQIGQLFQTLDFLTQEPTGYVTDEYQLDSRKYRLASRIEDITTGQFIDLHNFCRETDPEKLIANTANIIACVLVPYEGPIGGNDSVAWKPKVEKYLQTPHEDTVESILTCMPVTEALSIKNFFMMLWLGYCSVMLQSSEGQKMMKSLFPS